MKKILYTTTLSRTINAFLVPHIHSLIDQGIKVDCACFIDKEIDSKLLERGVNVYNIPFSRNPLGLNNYQAFKILQKIQLEEKYDYIHVHTPIAGLYGRLLKLKFKNLKSIYTAHGFHFHKGGSKVGWILYYPIERLMAHFTDILITINDEDYKRALHFPVKKVFKVNGVGLNFSDYSVNDLDKSNLRMKYNLKAGDFVIAMIAEINANKNHRQMIEAIHLLKQRNISVKVLCAGEGILFDKMGELIKEKGLESNIQLLGFTQNVKEVIAVSDIGVLLSYREGLPRSVMELMCCRKPVIGTDIRGNRDLIKHGKTGYLVPVNDAGQTANYIERFVQNPQLVEKMGAASHEAMKDFSMETVLKQMSSIMEGTSIYE